MKTGIAELRRTLGLTAAGAPTRTLPFGLPLIDAMLPGGGLDASGLHEIVSSGDASRLVSAQTGFASGILTRIAGPIVWCRKRRDLFAPALGAVGLDPGRILWVDAESDESVLSCVEDALRHGGAVAVVGETVRLSTLASRRLQLAAKDSDTLCLILRRPRGAEPSRSTPTAAQTRWRVSPLPAPPATLPGMPRGRWNVELLRCRGGEAASFIVEACDATGRLALPAELADRSLAAGELRRSLGG